MLAGAFPNWMPAAAPAPDSPPSPPPAPPPRVRTRHPPVEAAPGEAEQLVQPPPLPRAPPAARGPRRAAPRRRRRRRSTARPAGTAAGPREVHTAAEKLVPMTCDAWEEVTAKAAEARRLQPLFNRFSVVFGPF